MHKTRGQRDPAVAFPLASARDDADEQRPANRAVAVSAPCLAAVALGQSRGDPSAEICRQLPEAGSLTRTTRAAPG